MRKFHFRNRHLHRKCCWFAYLAQNASSLLVSGKRRYLRHGRIPGLYYEALTNICRVLTRAPSVAFGATSLPEGGFRIPGLCTPTFWGRFFVFFAVPKTPPSTTNYSSLSNLRCQLSLRASRKKLHLTIRSTTVRIPEYTVTYTVQQNGTMMCKIFVLSYFPTIPDRASRTVSANHYITRG